jgi:hypothetical protein
MLSRFDDYPVHQTPEPVMVPATSDRNFYDRYWMNGFSLNKDWYFGAAMGRYPHLGVLDAGFSLVADGRQHCINVSGRAPQDPTETSIGPLNIKIVEPMRQLRLTIDDTTLGADLLFTADTAPVNEGRQQLSRGIRTYYDVTRFAQYGSWTGEISFAGETLYLEPQSNRGTKDRSWGIRPVGAPEAPSAPSGQSPQFYFLWAPIHWQNNCTHMGLFEDEHGNQLHAGAASVERTSREFSPPLSATDVHATVVYRAGTRRLERGEFTITQPAGRTLSFVVAPELLFAMKGLGYGHPQWRHGLWRGELDVAHDDWILDDLDPLALENLHIQQLVTATRGDETGLGTVEQLCVGPHSPSGFTSLADGAR